MPQASKDCVQKTINRLEQKLKPDAPNPQVGATSPAPPSHGPATACAPVPSPQAAPSRASPRPQNLASSKRALQAMVFLLRSSTKAVQQRAAMSLARLAPDEQLKVNEPLALSTKNRA